MITQHTKTIAAISGVFLAGALAVLTLEIILIGGAKEKLIEKQQERAEIEAHNNELSALAILVEDSKEERTKLSSYILKNEEIIDFLSLLETLAEEQGLVLTMQIAEAELNENFEEIQLSIHAEGAYESILHVLKLLESLPYQSYIDSVRIEQSLDEIFVGGWEGEIKLRVVKEK